MNAWCAWVMKRVTTRHIIFNIIFCSDGVRHLEIAFLLRSMTDASSVRVLYCAECLTPEAVEYRIDSSLPDARFCTKCWGVFDSRLDVLEPPAEAIDDGANDTVFKERKKKSKKAKMNHSCYSSKAVRQHLRLR